jgi:hypothetical protein
MFRYVAGTWPVDYSITDKGIFAAQTAGSPEQASDFQASMEVMAVNVLWNFTNRIYSTYPTVLRPQLDRTYLPRSTFQGMGPVVPYPIGSVSSTFMPFLYNGQWFNLNCGVCGSSCQCGPGRRWSLELPGEVNEVTEVQINGVVLPSSDYWLDGNKLNRTDDYWPDEQEIRYPLGAVGRNTWGITYTRGLPVPSGGQLSAGVLAVQFAKAIANDKTCQLPQRIQTATRNSSTSTVVDSFAQLDKQRTGIIFVDNWIASVNQSERHAASVRSVDVGAVGRWI